MRNALIIALLIFCCAAPTLAQSAPSRAGNTAFALNGTALHTNGQTINLWGLDNIYAGGTSENLAARVAMDDIINAGPVHCIAKSNPNMPPILAQCLNAQERDIALLLISNGYGITNRSQLEGSELLAPYIRAEQHARAQNLGLWRNLGPTQQHASAQEFLTNTPALPLPYLALLLAVPMMGFAFIGLILKRGFKELVTLQKYQIAGTQKRERELKAREKHVIAAALESEINTNRAKLDAYLIIYEELLKSLRDPTKTPKYQRAGDIIHDKPALTRTVYDSNLDKLDLLGSDITNKLSALYQNIDPNPDYRTLEPEMPIEKVWETVERIIRNAEQMIDPMDQIVGALNVILRDRRLSP